MTHDSAVVWRALAPFACAVARIAPITFLCPVLGGTIAPGTVRLGVALALAEFTTRCVSTTADWGHVSLVGFVASLLGEVLLGLALGLAAAAPFDAARVGGRLIDLVRGSSAEAALPHAGTREAATGDLLYQLLVAIAASSLAVPHLVGAICKSFVVVPPGLARVDAVSAAAVIQVTAGVLSVGLALAAPIAATCLLVQLVFGLAVRLGPPLGLQEQRGGVQLMVGAIAFWVGLSGTAEALLDHADAVAQGLTGLVSEGLP